MTRTKTTRALAAILAFLLFATLLLAGMPVRAAGELVLKEGAEITYNKDKQVMKADAIAALVDLEASGIPADYNLDDFTLEYSFMGVDGLAGFVDSEGDNVIVNGIVNVLKSAGIANIWVNAESGNLDLPLSSLDFFDVSGKLQNFIKDKTGIGFSALHADKDQIVRVKYQNGDWAEGTLTVNKANVKVNVRSAALYFDQVRGENFVTTDPEDDFMIFTFYSGITTDLAPTIYFQPPQNDVIDLAMKFIDPLYKAANGVTLTDALNEGKTVGEMRVIADKAIDIVQKASQTAAGRAVLGAAGIDVDMINALVDGMQQIAGIADNWRFAIGQPDRAGAYVVSAVAINRNYNPGIGAGVLLVKMRLFGVSLQWADADAKTFTVGENKDLSAVAVYEGQAVKQNMLYTYVGLVDGGSPYLSTSAPTEAGKYLQAAFTLGGNYLAIPIARVVTINAAA